MKTLKKLIYLLTLRERKRAGLLLCIVLIMSLLEMAGLASIVPFMAVLANPEVIETNSMLNTAFQTSGIMFGIENSREFLFLLGIIVFVMLLLSLSFKALSIYAQVRFIEMRQYTIGRRVVEGYLNQPYSWFLNRNSSDLGKTILTEVGNVVNGALKQVIILIVQTAVTLSILTLLILVNPKLVLIIGLTFGLAYGLVYKFTRSFISRIGEERFKTNRFRFKAVSEAFGAVKEIKLGGLEQTYIERFSHPARVMARHVASSSIISNVPRFILEAIAFGGMLLIVLYFLTQTGDFSNTVPIISLYAFAGYRLMPALQGIYGAITALRFTGPALNSLYDDLISLQPPNPDNDKDILPLKKAISLKNISYHYPNSTLTTLKDIDLSIPACSTVGIVGPTGSGKTTTVDIILGLLEPEQGKLEVDGKVINKDNLRAWQRSIGYVPQQIYLADDTVTANIALGRDPKHIDQNAVERAAKVANVHEFIVNELPLNYQTTVGERGIRLSGGQRQRIGIARALYHNPQLLILDEATNALDNLTEQAVIDAVNNLANNITIILITHRLSTVKKCDNIFLLEKGELKQQGTFEKLIQASDNFRTAAKNIR